MYQKLMSFIEKHELRIENMEQKLEDDIEQYQESFDERDIKFDQGYLEGSGYLLGLLRKIVEEDKKEK